MGMMFLGFAKPQSGALKRGRKLMVAVAKDSADLHPDSIMIYRLSIRRLHVCVRVNFTQANTSWWPSRFSCNWKGRPSWLCVSRSISSFHLMVVSKHCQER